MAVGNEQAYRSLFQYFTPRLPPFVFSIVKTQETAEEIVQEVMLKLWTHKESIAQKDNPSSWVFSVAFNQAISFLRRVATERRYIDAIKSTMEESREKSPTEDKLILRENEQLLKLAINQLPPQQQLIYRMSRVEGLTHKEVAEKLGISTNKDKNHMLLLPNRFFLISKEPASFFFSFFSKALVPASQLRVC